ncbi:MAG: hypothetical protein ACR2KC_03860 [Acidimicrobiales bacterium]
MAPGSIWAVRQFIESSLVDQLDHKPQVVPTVEGGVQLEWHTVDIDLIIECAPSGPPSYYLSDLKHDLRVEGLVREARSELAAAFVELGFGQ